MKNKFVRFGINTFLFVWPFTNESVKLFPRFKKWGFESVEIPIDDPSKLDAHFIKAALERNGLACGAVTPCMGPECDLRGTAEQQRNALRFMQTVIDQMVALDCPTLSGVVYSSVGRADAVPRNEYRQQWRTVVKNLRQLCRYAADYGRIIAFEPINRFETDFINTCDQGLAMIEDVNHPALKLHLDTFHMNIEEKDPAASIRKTGKLLGHFHACGTDRGTPGNDHTDWKSISAALKAIKYEGDVTIESFTKDVKVIARAASIWRKIEPTREEIAMKGVKFLKKTLSR
jgi:D-psicose/D-tagatose/L-ribulose 3-epimerase